MSQHDTPIDEPRFDEPDQPSQMGQEPRTSILAIVSLVCSLVCCVPLLPTLGALLGIGGLVAISRNPMLRGSGLAITGIVLGLLFTLGQGLVAMSGVRGYLELRDVPVRMLELGYAGNYSDFRDRMDGAGTDEQAEQFFNELQSRYGEARAAEMNFDAFMQQFQQPGGPAENEITFVWRVEFENETVEVEAVMREEDQVPGAEFIVFRSLTIRDENRDDLRFPPGESEPDPDAP